jgi:hypothetical protein
VSLFYSFLIPTLGKLKGPENTFPYEIRVLRLLFLFSFIFINKLLSTVMWKKSFYILIFLFLQVATFSREYLIKHFSLYIIGIRHMIFVECYNYNPLVMHLGIIM